MNTDGSWALPAFLGHVLAPPSRCRRGCASIGDTPASSPRLHSGAEGWAGGAGVRGGMPAGEGGREGGKLSSNFQAAPTRHVDGRTGTGHAGTVLPGSRSQPKLRQLRCITLRSVGKCTLG